MGRFFVCPKTGLKRGAWTPEEDRLLSAYITRYGHWNWRELPKYAGLSRCGKSCRLRWMNYLRPNIKRGNYTREEEELIINLHEKLGNKWSAIAARLPGRTDNEIKNHWHSRLRTQTKPKMTFKDAKKKPSVKCYSVTNIVHPGNFVLNSSESWASSISDCKSEIVDQATTDEIELSFNPLSEFDKYILDEPLLGGDSYMLESSTASEENEISSSDSVLEFDESFGIESFSVKETFTPENFISATTEISPSSVSDFDANIWSKALFADIPENSTSDIGEVSSGSVTKFDASFWSESLSIGESLTPESNQSDVSEISMDPVLEFDESFSVEEYSFTPAGNNSSDESEISSNAFLELMEDLNMPEDNISALVDPSLLYTFSPLGEALYPYGL